MADGESVCCTHETVISVRQESTYFGRSWAETSAVERRRAYADRIGGILFAEGSGREEPRFVGGSFAGSRSEKARCVDYRAARATPRARAARLRKGEREIPENRYAEETRRAVHRASRAHVHDGSFLRGTPAAASLTMEHAGRFFFSPCNEA